MDLMGVCTLVSVRRCVGFRAARFVFQVLGFRDEGSRFRV